MKIFEHDEFLPQKTDLIGTKTIYLELKFNKENNKISVQTHLGVDAIIEFSMAFSEEFTRQSACSDITDDGEHYKEIDEKSIDLKEMQVLAVKNSYLIDPLILLYQSINNFFLWRRPLLTFFGSIYITLAIAYYRWFIPLSLLSFFLFSHQIVLLILKTYKPTKESNYIIYRRRVVAFMVPNEDND